MPLLISDANIVIDIVDGGLLEQMFQLEHTYAIPDVLYEEELAPYQRDLERLGIRILGLTPQAIERSLALYAENKRQGISSNDCMALTLAEQEECPLLTGDGKLRTLCQANNVVCKGTLWLVEEMFNAEIITCDQAEDAYSLMQKKGSRLPWDKIERQIKEFRQTEGRR